MSWTKRVHFTSASVEGKTNKQVTVMDIPFNSEAIVGLIRHSLKLAISSTRRSDGSSYRRDSCHWHCQHILTSIHNITHTISTRQHNDGGNHVSGASYQLPTPGSRVHSWRH